MELAKHTVTQQTNEFPTGLKSAQEIATAIGEITPERLIELADTGYLPHYRIDNGPAMFRSSEVRQWLANNLMVKCPGKAFPTAIRLVVSADEISEAPPMSICNVPYLQQVPKHGYQPGVYFLCRGADVVYVGQSTSPGQRIAQHISDSGKDFDRVYLLPVPISDLNNVEAAFIHHLRPAQQGGLRIGRDKPNSPKMTKPIDQILAAAGVAL